MAIDVLFVAHNRLEMTRESFAALAANTDWGHVTRLFVADDASTDGTWEWLEEHAAALSPVPVSFLRGFGGPVGAMNAYLTATGEEVDRFAKVDNDFVVSPGWLTEMLRLLTVLPDLDILGAEPWNPGGPIGGYCGERIPVDARHIGGKGIVRRRVFEVCRPSPNGANGYGGWTEWQMEHEHVRKAWICPDLPCFGLDQLPFEPWPTLTDRYARAGWARTWGTYPADGTFDAYWSWWEPKHL